MNVRRIHPSSLVACTLAVLAIAPAAGAWEARVKIEGQHHDNFLQAPDGAAKLDVTGRALHGRFAGHLERIGDQLEIFVAADAVSYDAFDDAARAVGGGVALRGRPQSFEFFAERYWDRPRFDVGETYDRASGLQVGGSFGYTTAAGLALATNFSLLDETYAITRDKDNRAAALGASLRYRGFGERFSPEVGITLNRLDFSTDNDDYDERDLYLKLRSGATSWLYLTARYRHRVRDYGVASPLASNLGREDTRDQLTLAADVSTGAHLVWSAYYSWQDASSTKPSRIFTTNLLTFALTLRLDG